MICASCVAFSLTALAVRVLVGFKGSSIPSRMLRMQPVRRNRRPIRFGNSSRGTNSYCENQAVMLGNVLAVPIRPARTLPKGDGSVW